MPGFYEESQRNTYDLISAVEWKGLLFSDVIYVHDINEVRMSAERYLILNKLCGFRSMKNVLLVTLKWDTVGGDQGALPEKELCNTHIFWGSAIK